MSGFFTRRGVAPSLGKRLSDYAVGETVFLVENNEPVEYLVIQQGLPDATIYDASCEGTWLLRKERYATEPFGATNSFEGSGICEYLNYDVLTSLDATVHKAIKTVKIPYRPYSGTSKTVRKGANGLSTKIFLLSGAEVGFQDSYLPTKEGVTLSYFLGTASSGGDSKRLLSHNWWLRSPCCDPDDGYSGGSAAFVRGSVGDLLFEGANSSYMCSARPALVLNGETKFDAKTNTIL